MSKPIAIALLVVGITMLIFASAAADSLGSFFSEVFQGTPDTRTLVLLIVGIFATVAGGIGVLRRQHS